MEIAPICVEGVERPLFGPVLGHEYSAARRVSSSPVVRPLGILEGASSIPQHHAWCLFNSNTRPFAVRLESVAEVVQVDRLVRLPLAPPRLVGLYALRRSVIPVFRIDGGISDADQSSIGKSIVLVLRSTQGTLGFLIDREGVEIHEEEPSPSENEPVPHAEREVHRGGVPHSVIDSEAAWQELDGSISAWYADRKAGM